MPALTGLSGYGSGRILSIALVIESTSAGSARHVLDLAEGLLKLGHRVVLIYSPLRADEAFLGKMSTLENLVAVSQSMSSSLSISDIQAASLLQKNLGRLGPFDIVHAHSSKAGGVLRVFGKRKTFHTVYTPHAIRTMDNDLSGPVRLFYGQLERWLARYGSEAVIAVSAQEHQECRRIGIPETLLHTVANGISPPDLRPRELVRRELDLSPGEIVVGFVGRLARQKGPERLLSGFAALQREDIRLAILGDGELAELLDTEITRLGMSGRVRLYGARDGQQAMPAFDLLVVPSRYESAGYVFLEAAAAGVPILSTRVGIAGDVIREGENGFMVDNVDDSRVWSGALARALAPDVLNRLKASAQSRKRLFDAEQMVAQTLAVYASVLSAADPRAANKGTRYS
jgi:glycosyltransferase involved in cell wall biosynthesis